MDLSVKVMINAIVIFIGIILFTSCITFFLLAANARSILYATTQYVEIYGNQTEKINEIANSTNTNITVTMMNVTPLSGYRYQIKVSFVHMFAWLNLSKSITYTGVTRLVAF